MRKRNKFITFINVILIAVFALILAVFILLQVFPEPTVYGKTFIIMDGDSMTSENVDASIEDGSGVLVDTEKEIQLGDAVLCKLLDGDVVTFLRIVGEREDNGETIYLAKTDKNDVDKAVIVKKDEIVGVAIYKLPILGKAIVFMQSGFGMIILIAIPLVIAVIWGLFTILKKYEKEVLDEDDDDETTEKADEDSYEYTSLTEFQEVNNFKSDENVDDEPIIINREPVKIMVAEDGSAEYNKLHETANAADLEKVLPSGGGKRNLEDFKKTMSESVYNRATNPDKKPKTPQKKTSNQTLEELMRLLDNQK